MKPLILLADDDAAFRTALRNLLEPHCTVAGSVRDGLVLLRAAQASDPDEEIADTCKPVLNAIQAASQVMSAQTDGGVIFLTVYREPALTIRGRKTAALGYLFSADLPIT